MHVDAQPLQVVELLGQPAEVAGAVGVAVEEAAQVDLVEDGLLEPQRDRPRTNGPRTLGAVAASCRVHPQDVAGALARVQAHVVAAHAPVVALAVEQVLGGEGGRHAELVRAPGRGPPGRCAGRG